MSNIIFKFTYCLYLLSVTTGDPQTNYDSICAAQQTCSQCLQIPTCVWCSELRYNQNNGSLIRCATREKFENVKNRWCPSEYVVAEKSFFKILENKPLLSKNSKDTVQVQPQKMRIYLRRGEELVITVNYSKAEDYPVDLYYLMDLSFSMEPYRDQLSNLGNKLAETMKKLTSNFRLGFGSFVDKVALPMTSTDPDMLKSPCKRSKGEPCASPYGYKNQMPLTENVALFKSRVKEAPVSGNADIPEGGFDAIMQAIVCIENIGWRDKARHLLVFSTDASFHLAGDGRLAGIVEPNDGLCHLDKNGFYSHSLLQDYPSISQINRKAIEQNINIIFAVPEHMNMTYQLLTKSISGSSIGLFEDEAKNVVSLVSKEYEKLVDSVTMADNAPKMIDIKYFSKCLDENSKERRTCEGLRVGNAVQFHVVIKATDCPQNFSEWRQIVKIGPRGLTENLQLDVELICSCPCETENQVSNIKKSPVCKNNGNLICGICICDDGFYGKQCECKGTEIGSNALDTCKASNESEICSGCGTCKCGVCDCTTRLNPQEEFYGTYCECDNFSCKRSGGLVCGGRGKCECGFCNCLPGWIGETCDCKEINRTCMPSHDSSIVCSGRGDCVCGSCHCHETENVRYSGQFCEECPTCPGQQCEVLKDCVECLAYKSGPLWQNNECNNCPHKLGISKVERLEVDFDTDKENNSRICHTPGDGGCSLVFKYELIRSSLQNKERFFKIIAEKEKNCPKPVNVMGVAIGVIISTVFLGFSILMIWKALTMIHDRKEYARFEKERHLVRWERAENPFYKKATTTFNNPTFKQNTKNQNS